MNRRRVSSIAALIVVIAAGVVVLARHHFATSGRGATAAARGATTAVTAAAAPQPAVPVGWRARSVGPAKVAVPDGWIADTHSVTGTIVGAWWPGPPKPGTPPSRCAIQDRPGWLLTFLDRPGDWLHALQGALHNSENLTDQGPVHATVTGVHPVTVRGASAALAFTAHVHDTAAPSRPVALDTADLLAALADGTEVHVFCSGPTGTLPDHFAEAVDSVTLQ